MDQNDRARVALAAVLSVVGAIAISKSGIGPHEGVARWLAFSLAAGLVINTQDGRPTGFLLAAATAASGGLVGTLLWLALLNDGVLPGLSGVPIDFIERPQFSGTIIGGLWLVSSVSVFVCSLSRPATLSLMKDAFAVKLSKARHVESLLRMFFAIGSGAWLLFNSIL